MREHTGAGNNDEYADNYDEKAGYFAEQIEFNDEENNDINNGIQFGSMTAELQHHVVRFLL